MRAVGWVTFLSGAVAASVIWLFDIENPNVTAPLALAVGSVAAIAAYAFAHRATESWMGHGAEGAEREQRLAGEREVGDVERDVEEP